MRKNLNPKINEARIQKSLFLKNMTLIDFLKMMISIVTSAIKNLRDIKNLKLKFTYMFLSLNSHKIIRNREIYYSEETLSILLKSEKSFIRWGDGETFLALGQDIFFQDYNSDLARELTDLLTQYESNSNYYLGLPLTPLVMGNFDLIRSGYFFFWYKSRYLINAKLSIKPKKLLDAFIFRPVGLSTKADIELLWLNKNVVLVHNSEDVFNDFLKIYPKSISKFVEISKKNAYSDKDRIIQEILSLKLQLHKEDSEKKVVVLISAGPTAKSVIVFLSKINLTCYDMGHFFEWKFYNKDPRGVL